MEAVASRTAGKAERFGQRFNVENKSEQKKKYLSGIADGTKIGAIGITEPTGGSDAIGGMRLRAIRDDDQIS